MPAFRPVLVLAVSALALALAGCPKEGTNSSTPAASPANSSAAAAPTAMPGMTTTMEPAPALADDAPPQPGETVIHYRWSGGLSIYQWYSATIRGTDTAKVVFMVKPARSEAKRVEETLDAAQFKELKDLFEKVHFDDLQMKPRAARIMDIGQVVVTREGDGHPKKEVVTNGQTTTTADDTELRKWFDTHIRAWLDKAGVGTRPAATPAASPSK